MVSLSSYDALDEFMIEYENAYFITPRNRPCNKN